MSMPFYVAPEQLMKDKADYARRNIARGRPLVACAYTEGIVIAAENTYRHLHKISEIYDRIAFAGVGKYNEFEQLRRSGVQHADVKGYQFSREDVDARSLANLYSQFMGNVFTHDMKPLEAEILVAEVGSGLGEDELYHVTFDGFVFDESRFVVLGGEAETITERMEAAYQEAWDLGASLKAAITALSGEERTVPNEELEVAVLERSAPGRAFRRLELQEITALMA
jgi:proteasome alpha subunit